MEENRLSKEEQARLERLQPKSDLFSSGFAGIDPITFKIVDRRENPKAVPVQKSTPMGIPEPKQV